MFASDGGFSELGYRMVSVKFYSARPPLPCRGGARGDPDGGATFPDRGAQFYMPC